MGPVAAVVGAVGIAVAPPTVIIDSPVVNFGTEFVSHAAVVVFVDRIADDRNWRPLMMMMMMTMEI